MVNVDKGIPMPRENADLRYPWGEMDIGDSFAIRGKPRSAYSMASHNSARYGRKFCVRKHQGELRVWRVK